MPNLDKEFLKVYNRIQQVSVIIENVLKLNHKIVDGFNQYAEFTSRTQLKTNEFIAKRITLLEEIAAILSKLHETEIGMSKINELLSKAKTHLEEYKVENKKIIERGEFGIHEFKLLEKETENLEVEIKNFMSNLAEKVDKKKLKLEQKNDKK